MINLELLSKVFTIPNLLLLLNGAKVTIILSLIGIAGGTIIGLIAAILRTFDGRGFGVIKGLIILYVQIARRVPLLILLLLSYVSLYQFTNLSPSNLVIASIAVVIYAGAYMTETIRSGIESLPETQWQAGRAIGFSQINVLRHIILPQALRVAIPPSVSFMQSLIKDTSMAVIIGLIELARAGVILRLKEPFASFYIFAAIMIMYFIICFPLQYYSEKLEGKFKHLSQT